MHCRCPSGSRLAVYTYPNLNITGLAGSQLATVGGGVGGTTLTLTYPSNVLAPFSGLLSPFSTTSPLYVAFISQNIFAPTYVPVTKTSTTTGMSCIRIFTVLILADMFKRYGGVPPGSARSCLHGSHSLLRCWKPCSIHGPTDVLWYRCWPGWHSRILSDYWESTCGRR